MHPDRQPVPTATLRTQCFRGFTLIELLTVIAIIGVLATLLFTALAGAKKRSRQARCTSNLHQIALAINLFLDDFGNRPADLPVLINANYLPAPAVLLCPEDKTGNWGGLHNFPPLTPSTGQTFGGQLTSNQSFGYSYLHPLSWPDDFWNELVKSGPSAGIAVCQLHGLAHANSSDAGGFPSSILDFEGMILRAQMDGAVVRRQFFWPTPQPSQASATADPSAPSFNLAAPAQPQSLYPWPLFSDDPPQ